MRRLFRVFIVFCVLALPLLACGPIARIASPTTPAPGDGGTLPPINLPPDDARRTVLEFAFAQVGKRYTQWAPNRDNSGLVTCGWGGGTCTRNGPDCYDCSSLTGAAYQQLGVQLGPTTRQQISDGIGVDFTPSQWQPSDLLLFCGDGVTPSHVALWIGDGSGQIVHAANCEYGVYISGMVTSQPLCGVRRIIGG